MLEQPEQLLNSFIDKFSGDIADLVRHCRRKMLRRFPTAFELVYDNYNALAIGYSPTDRPSDCIVSLAVYPNNVALSFYRGAKIPDPNRRLSGSGKQNRYVRLLSADVLDDPEVADLVDRACTLAVRPFPSDPGVKTIIKSVSAKQRPRRPPHRS